MRRLFIALAGLVALVLLLVGGVAWWAGTDGSLARALRMAQQYLPEDQTLEFSDASGSLGGGGHIARLQWSRPGTRVTVDGLTLAWSLRGLLGRELRVRTLAADSVHVELTPAPEEPDAQPFTMPEDVRLPIEVTTPLTVARLQIDRTGEDGLTATQVIEDIALRYVWNGERHALDLESLRAGASTLTGALSLQAADLALQARLEAALRDLAPGVALAMQARLTATGRLSGGDAARVDIALDAREDAGEEAAGAQLDADITVHPWRPQPLQQLRLVARSLNARAFAATAPATAFSGSARVDPAASTPGTWDVQLDLTNDAAGTWEARRIPLRSLVARARLTAERLDVQHAEAVMAHARPAGSVSASGSIPLRQVAQSTLRLVLSQIDLQPWAEALPRTALDGEASMGPLAEGEGWQVRTDVANALPGPLDAERLPLTRLLAAARFTPQRWLAETIELHVGEGRLRLQGEFDPVARSLEARGELQALPLRRIHGRLASAASTSLSGTLGARGDLAQGIAFESDIASTATAGARRGEWEIRAVRSQGTWSPGRLEIRSLDVDALGARVEGRDIEAALPDLATVTGRLTATAPGLALDGEASMRGDSPAGTVNLALESARQTVAWLRDLPVVGGLIPAVEARGSASLTAEWQGGWQQWLQGLEDPAAHPDLHADVALQAQALQVTWPADDEGRPGAVIVAEQFEARAQGNLGAAELVVAGDLAVNDMATVLDAGLRMTQAPVEGAPRWQFVVDRLGASATLPQQEQPWNLQIAPGLQVSVQAGTGMRVEATAGEATLTPPRDVAGSDQPLRLAWQPLTWRRDADGATQLASSGRLSGLRPGWIDALMAAQGEGPLAAAGMYTDLVLAGEWDIAMTDRLDVRARLTREAGDLGFGRERDEGVAAGIRTFDVRVQSEGEAVSLVLDWDTERAGVINASVRTELSRRGGGWSLPPDAPLAGTVQARLQDLAMWGFLAPPGWRVQGELEADIRMDGTVQSPQLQGEIAGRGLNIRSVLDGVDLHDGTLRARLAGRRLEIAELTLQGGTGSRAYVRGLSGNRTPPPTDRGRMTATGSIDWSGVADAAPGQSGIDMDLRARLEKMQVLVRNDRQVSLSGELDAGLARGRLRVRGDLTVDRAAIVLPEASAPTLGDDVVVVRNADLATAAGETPAARGELQTAQPMDLEINLDLGRDLALEGYGITTRLEGELTVSSATSGADPFRIVGEVRTSEGRFRAWGQALNVETGVVLFNGSYSNPSLNLLAIRPEIPVRAGVRVTGTLNAPRVLLYSEPDMPESEKLSWVVLGRATATTGAEGTSMQQAALGLLAGGVGSSLAQGLGLDELGMGESSVSIGKRISDELYVTYEAGLSGAASTLYVFYDITRRFTLRGQTGEASAVDLIYTITYD